MKQTQCQRIVNYINDYGSITQLDALREFGCMRLASRINDLKRAGYPVLKRMKTAKNKYGEAVSFAEYYMEGNYGS